MRMRLRTLKGRNHLQLIDEEGRIHHIGPVRSKKLEKCIKNMFLGDYILTYGIIKKYLESKGFAREEANNRAIQYVSSNFEEHLNKLVTEEVFQDLMGLMKENNGDTSFSDIKIRDLLTSSN